MYAIVIRYAEICPYKSEYQLCLTDAVSVKVSVVIKRDGRPDEFHSSMYPGRKPLVDIVRPLLYRKLPQISIDRGDRFVVKLDNTGAPDDIRWTSHASRLVVMF